MENSSTRQFPIRTLTHVIEQASLGILRDQLPPHWIVRTGGTDYGIDGELEIVGINGVVTGNIIKFQIKGHEKLRFKEQSIIQRVNVSTINYWLEIPLPVILFVVGIEERVVYWVDVKNYIRDTLSIDRPNLLQQKTTQIKVPTKNQLTDSLRLIEEIALLHKEQIKSYQIALEQKDVADFVGYHIFIHLFGGDIDAWEKYLRRKGSVQQLLNDFPFVIWLKEQLEEDEDLINRIKRLVEETTQKGR